MEWFILADLMDLGNAIQEYGPFYGLLTATIAFFIWRDWKREEKLSARVTTLEDEFKNVLVPLVRDNTQALTQNTRTMQESKQVMERVERQLL